MNTTDEQGCLSSIMLLDLGVQLDSARKYVDALIAGGHSGDLARHVITYFDSFIGRHPTYFTFRPEDIPKLRSYFLSHTVQRLQHYGRPPPLQNFGIPLMQQEPGTAFLQQQPLTEPLPLPVPYNYNRQGGMAHGDSLPPFSRHNPRSLFGSSLSQASHPHQLTQGGMLTFNPSVLPDPAPPFHGQRTRALFSQLPPTRAQPVPMPANVYAILGPDADDASAVTQSLALQTQSPSSSLSTHTLPPAKRKKEALSQARKKQGRRYNTVAQSLRMGPHLHVASAVSQLTKIWRCPSKGVLLGTKTPTRNQGVSAFCGCIPETNDPLRIRIEKGECVEINNRKHHMFEVKYDHHQAEIMFLHSQKSPPSQVTDDEIVLYLEGCVKKMVEKGGTSEIPFLYPQLFFDLTIKGAAGCATARGILLGTGGFFATSESTEVGSQSAKLTILIQRVVRSFDHSTTANEDFECRPTARLVSAPGSTHTLLSFVDEHSISSYLRRTPIGPGVIPTYFPPFPTLQIFVKFWNFKSADQLLTIPFRPEFLDGTNFTEATSTAAKINSVYFTCPHHLWALYKLVSATPDHKLTFAAIDAVFGLYRSGPSQPNPTCIVALSSVRPDIPCPSNSLVVRRHVPLPKALTTSENGGTSHVLLKCTVWALLQLTGLEMDLSYVVKDMGAALHKGVGEYGRSVQATTGTDPGNSIQEITDVEHIRGAPLGIWCRKISTVANRRMIGHDITLLHATCSHTNFNNALTFFLQKWTSLGEETFVNHFRSLLSSGLLSPFYFRVCDLPGYCNNNQPGERSFRTLKGARKLNEPGVLNTSLGLSRLLNEGIPAIMRHDSKLLTEMDLQGGISPNLRGRTVPSVVDLSIAALMTADDVHLLPNGGYLCNSPRFLGSRITKDRIDYFFSERDSDRADFSAFTSLSAYVDCTRGFCHVCPLDRDNPPPSQQHLLELQTNFICVSCPRFHAQLECAAQQFLNHGGLPGIHGYTITTITSLLTLPFSGRNTSYSKPGRRRVRGNPNAGNPCDTLGDLGLPGDYHNAAVQFLCTLTLPTLSAICRERGIFPKTSEGRTKSVLLQLILCGTYLGDNILAAVQANHVSVFATYHRAVSQRDAVLATGASDLTRWPELFDPLPSSNDPEFPLTSAGYFLTALQRVLPTVHGVNLMAIMVACKYFQRNLLLDSNFVDVASAVDIFRRDGTSATNANEVFSLIQLRELPEDATTVVHQFPVAGGTPNESMNQARLALEGLAQSLSCNGEDAKSCWLSIPQRQVAILKFLSPDQDESEFHIIDPVPSRFSLVNEHRTCASRTIVCGVDSLSRFLVRLYKQHSLRSSGRRVGGYLAHQTMISVRIYSVTADPEDNNNNNELNHVGCGVDGENIPDGSPGLPVQVVVAANTNSYPGMAPPVAGNDEATDMMENLNGSTVAQQGLPTQTYLAPSATNYGTSTRGDSQDTPGRPIEADTIHAPPPPTNNDSSSEDMVTNYSSPFSSSVNSDLQKPGDGERGVVDLYAEEQWEEPSMEMWASWNTGRENGRGAQRDVVAEAEDTHPVQEKQRTPIPRTDEDTGSTDNCPLCGDPYTGGGGTPSPETYNTSCKHRLCLLCCTTWMGTSLFDQEGRWSYSERIIKSGACVLCKCIQGTWKQVADDALVPSQGLATHGYWERNNTLQGKQVKEVAIKDLVQWNCLAVFYDRPSLVVTSVPLPTVVECQAIQLRFLVDQELNEDPDFPGTFVCVQCSNRVALKKKCRKATCKDGCDYSILCFGCAWAYTEGIKSGKVEGVKSNRYNLLARTVGDIKFKCESCGERGLFRRFDGEVLDGTLGFCYSPSMRWRASPPGGGTLPG
jgi:hypothetical protein